MLLSYTEQSVRVQLMKNDFCFPKAKHEDLQFEYESLRVDRDEIFAQVLPSDDPFRRSSPPLFRDPLILSSPFQAQRGGIPLQPKPLSRVTLLPPTTLVPDPKSRPLVQKPRSESSCFSAQLAATLPDFQILRKVLC